VHSDWSLTRHRPGDFMLTMHRKKLHLHHGWNSRNNLTPRRITTKPSASNIANGVRISGAKRIGGGNATGHEISHSRRPNGQVIWKNMFGQRRRVWAPCHPTTSLGTFYIQYFLYQSLRKTEKMQSQLLAVVGLNLRSR